MHLLHSPPEPAEMSLNKWGSEPETHTVTTPITPGTGEHQILPKHKHYSPPKSVAVEDGTLKTDHFPHKWRAFHAV